jgi:hypothetical protein
VLLCHLACQTSSVAAPQPLLQQLRRFGWASDQQHLLQQLQVVDVQLLL